LPPVIEGQAIPAGNQRRLSRGNELNGRRQIHAGTTRSCARPRARQNTSSF
jgi:hypothetical protein